MRKNRITIGILDIQGDTEEHLAMTNNAMENLNLEGDVTLVKKRSDIKELSGMIIPGGESTVIGRFLDKDMREEIKKLAKRGGAIMGTCAGSILMAKECSDNRVNLLEFIDMSINRNAYGRQMESFEEDVLVNDIGKFHCVFIRAPIIEKTWGNAKVLAEFDGKPVFLQQDRFLAMTFHPELTSDTRIHEHFLNLVKNE